MTILIDIRSLMVPHLSGVGEYTYHVTNQMIKQGADHRFVLWSNSGRSLEGTVWEEATEQWGKEAHVTIAHGCIPNKLLHASFMLAGRPTIESRAQDAQSVGRIDVVFMPNLHFFAVERDTKLVVTVHDLSLDIYPEFFGMTSQWWHRCIRPKMLLKRADKIIAVSERTKRDMMAMYGLPEAKITTIHPGIDAENKVYAHYSLDRDWSSIRELYQLPQRYILYLGTLEPRKNIESIIAAFDRLAGAWPEAPDLVIAGMAGWRHQPIFSAWQNARFRDRIHLAGYIEPRDKPLFYQNASLFVYPSFYEGFGFPPLEAMAYGTPVIAGFSGALPEVLEKSAVLVDPYNIEDIAHMMKILHTDHRLRDELIQSGKEQVKKYRWEQSAREVLEVLVS